MILVTTRSRLSLSKQIHFAENYLLAYLTQYHVSNLIPCCFMVINLGRLCLFNLIDWRCIPFFEYHMNSGNFLNLKFNHDYLRKNTCLLWTDGGFYPNFLFNSHVYLKMIEVFWMSKTFNFDHFNYLKLRGWIRMVFSDKIHLSKVLG